MMDINPIIERANNAEALVRELKEQLKDQIFMAERFRKRACELEQAKLSVARVMLQEDGFNINMQLISINNSPDGLIIRVSK